MKEKKQLNCPFLCGGGGVGRGVTSGKKEDARIKEQSIPTGSEIVRRANRAYQVTLLHMTKDENIQDSLYHLEGTRCNLNTLKQVN